MSRVVDFPPVEFREYDFKAGPDRTGGYRAKLNELLIYLNIELLTDLSLKVALI